MSAAPVHEAFRRKDLVAALARSLTREAAGLGPLRFMHVCGTHERSVNQYGLRQVLPPNVHIVAGPGCPVCVCPVAEILAAKALALRPGTIVASFGDMLSVPVPGGSLIEARRDGASIRLVYSASDALALARSEAGKEVVFLSVGFETTSAPTAALLASLEGGAVPNFSILSSSRLVPEALRVLIERRMLGPDAASGPPIDGLILPGHVSAIVGSEAFRFLVRDFGIPCAVAGFEPVDLLAALVELIRQRRAGKAELVNAYSRAVLSGGNAKAKGLLARVFEVRDAEWRGLGTLPGTGLAIRPEFSAYDAWAKHRDCLDRASEANGIARTAEDASCLCARVVLGRAEPGDCPSFGSPCVPANPLGPCMVSEEGTCRIRFEYGGGG